MLSAVTKEGKYFFIDQFDGGILSFITTYPAVAKSPHSVPPAGLCAGETKGDRPGGGAILLLTPPGGGGKPIPDPPVRDFPVRDDSPSFFCESIGSLHLNSMFVPNCNLNALP